ncbi:phosphotransferase family protein [Pontibacter sp. G13]|uniref:phosphotransferase family protein n=1 Tax=Pontibacter sp. G13 TaxID=3074898 RepID=UPI00288A0252|nr:phosphotransferase family protein [Pontibacter sp. G13]WNJ19980.1 phosphotransferase family protein [Pontibacter sp. G13]
MNSQSLLDQPRAIRQGEELDLLRLTEYLQQQFPDIQGAVSVSQFPKGYSNLTYLIKKGETEWVLRRPPFGANIRGGHDMGREFRVLSALKGSFTQIPEPMAFEETGEWIGAPFYLMERVRGRILRGNMTPEETPSPELMGQMGDNLVTTLVNLHQVPLDKPELKALGKPMGYVERQVSGWIKRYGKSKTDDIPEMDRVGEWLAANMPTDGPPTVIHNDFKYDNLVFDLTEPAKVLAVLDWEMATLGDPWMDVGTSLGYWVNPDDPDWMKMLNLSPTTLSGNLTRGQLVTRYERISGKTCPHPTFYYAFGLYKIAVIVQQIYARYKQGLTQDPRFGGLIMGVNGCAKAAWQAIQRDRLDGLFES